MITILFLLIGRKFFSRSFIHIPFSRYRNGNDHIGEHKDNEAELDKNTPIASLSLGQKRVFVLKHQDCRKKGEEKKNIPKGKLIKIVINPIHFYYSFVVEIELDHGSLLLMNPPTNTYWYHSLPIRKNASGVRVNLTFRKIN